jgi:UTP--glucose-1-phosphate uridylyltransferase
VNFIFIRQGDAMGLGHAVLCGRPAVGDSPFAVILPDELLYTVPGTPNATQQLITAYQQTGQAVVGVGHVLGKSIEQYGCIDVLSTDEHGVMTLHGIVEKPAFANAPSQFAAFGRYVFPPVMFDYLASVKPGRGGEIQLTDGIAALIADDGAVAVNMDALRYDCGTKIGFLEANLDFALRHPELGAGFKAIVESRIAA